MKQKTDKPQFPKHSVIPCYCTECGWNGDISETTKEVLTKFGGEKVGELPLCPDCSCDIRMQE